jgi:S1-C subfamily serine protease
MANATARPQYTEVRRSDTPAAQIGGGGYGPYFGSVPDFRDDLNGVLFADVRTDSPAAKAGLKAGDLLVEFGGQPVRNLQEFTYALSTRKPGDVVVVVVRREGQTLRVNVTLEVRR